MREFEIGVSVHGWVEGLTSKPPSQNGMKFLSRQSEINFNSLPYRIHLYLEYSDALLFDFLVDGFFYFLFLLFIIIIIIIYYLLFIYLFILFIKIIYFIFILMYY